MHADMPALPPLCSDAARHGSSPADCDRQSTLVELVRATTGPVGCPDAVCFVCGERTRQLPCSDRRARTLTHSKFPSRSVTKNFQNKLIAFRYHPLTRRTPATGSIVFIPFVSVIIFVDRSSMVGAVALSKGTRGARPAAVHPHLPTHCERTEHAVANHEEERAGHGEHGRNRRRIECNPVRFVRTRPSSPPSSHSPRSMGNRQTHRRSHPPRSAGMR